MVAEACQPGASVAEIARRHGVNANLLFNWRKRGRTTALGAAAPKGSAAHSHSVDAAPAAGAPGFIPIGMVGRATDEGPPLIAAPSAMVRDKTPSLRTALDERPGMIEIDLVDGTRLRVDAFVNERSLRRVLAVLKATS